MQTTNVKGKDSPDFETVNGGSVILVIPLTRDARRWTLNRIEPDVPRLGQGFAVEPRYFPGLVEEIMSAGLEVA